MSDVAIHTVQQVLNLWLFCRLYCRGLKSKIDIRHCLLVFFVAITTYIFLWCMPLNHCQLVGTIWCQDMLTNSIFTLELWLSSSGSGSGGSGFIIHVYALVKILAIFNLVPDYAVQIKCQLGQNQDMTLCPNWLVNIIWFYMMIPGWTPLTSTIAIPTAPVVLVLSFYNTIQLRKHVLAPDCAMNAYLFHSDGHRVGGGSSHHSISLVLFHELNEILTPDSANYTHLCNLVNLVGIACGRKLHGNVLTIY